MRGFILSLSLLCVGLSGCAQHPEFYRQCCLPFGRHCFRPCAGTCPYGEDGRATCKTCAGKTGPNFVDAPLIAAAAQVPSRFHPVPTRPVFGPASTEPVERGIEQMPRPVLEAPAPNVQNPLSPREEKKEEAREDLIEERLDNLPLPYGP